MNFKKYWFGHSLVWMGVLYNGHKPAIAQTVPLPAQNLVSPEIEQTSRSNPVAQVTASISPPEVVLPVQRLEQNDLSLKPNLDTSGYLSTDTSLKNLLEIETQGQPHQEEQPNSDIETQIDEDPSSQFPSPAYPSDSEFISDEIEENIQNSNSTEAIDPELGRLRLYETEAAIEEDEVDSVEDSQSRSSETGDPELGRLRLSETANGNTARNYPENGDPELGRLRLNETEAAIEEDIKEDIDTVFLVGGVDYFRSNNMLLSDFDPVNDQFARAGISLLAIPSLGPQTQLLASAGGSIAFYDNLSELNYRTLEFRTEVQQTLFPNTYASLGWSNRQFFAADEGDRFLNDHSLRFALSRRDAFTSELMLDSFYQLRLSFADPSDRSRLTNTLGTSLNYALQSNLEVGLNYQLDLTEFTQQERADAYHQVTAQLNYDLSNNSRVSLYAGFSFGRSSNSDIDFDSSIIGISFDTFLPLF